MRINDVNRFCLSLMLLRVSVTAFAMSLLGSVSALAQSKDAITFQGFLKAPNGSNPTASGVTARVQILSPADTRCVLREEVHSDVAINDGYFTIVLGNGTVSSGEGSLNPSPILSMTQALDNSSSRTGLHCFGASGGTASVGSYAPSDSHGRRVRVVMTIQSDQVIGEFNIRGVGYATHASRLNGRQSTDFINVNNATNQTRIDNIMSRYDTLKNFLDDIQSDAAADNLTCSNVSGVVAIANGGTGASNAPNARANLGLGPLATLATSGNASQVLRGDGTWGFVSLGTISSTNISDWNTAVDTRITAQKGANNGVATLGAGGKVPSSQLALVASDVPALDWSKITSGLPTTLSGYGITNGVVNGGGTGRITSDLDANKPSSPASGDLFVATDTNKLYRYNGSAWVEISPGVSGTIPLASGGTGATTQAGAANAILPAQSGQTGKYLTTDGTNVSWATVSGDGGGGTVTSVDVAVPNFLTASGGPVTAAGTINIGLSSQSTRKVFAGPTSGSGAPTFRDLTIADIQSSVSGTFMATSAACAAGQMLTYTSVNDQLSCQSYSLATNAVTSASISDGAVASAKIADGAVTSAKLADAAVATATIANNAVTDAKINDVAWSKVSGKPTSLSGYGITDAIVANKGAVPGVSAGTSAPSSPANGDVWIDTTNNRVQRFDGAAWVTVGSASAGDLSGTLSVTRLPAFSGGDVTSSAGSASLTIGNNSITSTKISDGSVTSAKLADDAVATAKIANNAVTDAKINDVAWSKVSGKPTSLSGYGITDAGDITGVTAGAGLITGGTAGDVTLNVGAGTGMTVSADAVAVDVGLGIGKIPQVGAAAIGAGGVVIANGAGTGLASLNCTNGQVIKFNASGVATCDVDAGSSGNTFIQSGNSFGSAATIGTNDNFALNLETNGSTRVTISNDGNVGIGTTGSPTAKLEISGASGSTLKIVDGNQGAGKVLTSDANGQASWQTPAASLGGAQTAETSSKIWFTTHFEGVNATGAYRYQKTTSSGHTINGGKQYVSIGGSSAGFAQLSMGSFTPPSLYAAGAEMAIVVHGQSNSTTSSCEGYIGTGSIPVSASGHTWTAKHIGLRYIWNASGVTVYASVGNGSAQSTVALGGSVNSTRKIKIKYVSSSLVEFYDAKVLVASLTTNIPVGYLGDTFVQASTAQTSGTDQCLLYLDRFAYAEADL